MSEEVVRRASEMTNTEQLRFLKHNEIKELRDRKIARWGLAILGLIYLLDKIF